MYEHKWIFPVEIKEEKSIYDADTFKIIVDQGFDTLHKATIRSSRIDAYEVRHKKGVPPSYKARGIAGRDFLRSILVGKKVYLRTIKGSKKGKYGRYLAEVYLPSDELSSSTITKYTLKTAKHLTTEGAISRTKMAIPGLININDLVVAMGFAIYKKY